MTPDAVAERLQSASGPVLLLAVSRSFVAELARATDREVVTADIGAPLFGAPGAIGTGRYEGGGWKLLRIEALCTLDAARFRLPLLMALQRAVSGDAWFSCPVSRAAWRQQSSSLARSRFSVPERFSWARTRQRRRSSMSSRRAVSIGSASRVSRTRRVTGQSVQASGMTISMEPRRGPSRWTV